MIKIIFSIIFASFLITFNANAANVTLTGATSVNVLNSFFFSYRAEVSTIGSEVAIIDSYDWSFNNSAGIFQMNNSSSYSHEISFMSDVENVKFLNTFGACSITLNVTVHYHYQNNTIYSTSAQLGIHIYAICNTIKIMGPESIRKCLKPLTMYYVYNYCNCQDWAGLCNGLGFLWTVPNGWTIVGPNNGMSVNIRPDNSTSGNVTCKITTIGTADSRTVMLNVSRPNPVIAISCPSYDICPGINYSINLTGSTSGIESVNWSALNCTITSTGNGTSAILTSNISTTSSAILSNIRAMAYYTGGCIVITTYNIKLHSIKDPPTPTNKFKLTVTKYCDSDDLISIVEFKYTGITDPNSIITGDTRTLLFKKRNQTLSIVVKFTNPCTNVSKSRTFTIQSPACLQ